MKLQNLLSFLLTEEKLPRTFWGKQGAGILLIAQDTGRVLLTLRSSYVKEPNTWGIPGGAMDEGETNPEEAARREAREELGFDGELIKLIPAYVFKIKNFEYHNYIGLVPTEFTPTLDWENSRALWFDIDKLPKRLHFGVKHLFKNARRMIKSIKNNKL